MIRHLRDEVGGVLIDLRGQRAREPDAAGIVDLRGVVDHVDHLVDDDFSGVGAFQALNDGGGSAPLVDAPDNAIVKGCPSHHRDVAHARRQRRVVVHKAEACIDNGLDHGALSEGNTRQRVVPEHLGRGGFHAQRCGAAPPPRRIHRARVVHVAHEWSASLRLVARRGTSGRAGDKKRAVRRGCHATPRTPPDGTPTWHNGVSQNRLDPGARPQPRRSTPRRRPGVGCPRRRPPPLVRSSPGLPALLWA